MTFSQAGVSGGVTNNANAGQTISIANNLGQAVSGVQLTQAGSSTLILTGTNTYTGGTTISAGTLQIGNGGTTGSIIGDVLNDGSLVFSRSNGLGYGGTISGSGSVTIQNTPTGFTILTGANTYTGGTTISSGTLVLGNGAGGGTSGSIVGDVLNNGQLTFNRSDDITFDGLISGSGAVSKFGAGVLTLTADNTYSNGTVIAAGTLQLGNGGTSGNIGSSTVDNGGTLAFNRSDTFTFSAVISGTGNVVQMGPGTTVLGAGNSYLGGTTITSGTLQVTSDTSVSSGAVTLNGGTFQVDGASDLTFANAFNVNTAGGTVDNNGTVLTLAGVIANGDGNTGVLQVTDSSGGFGTTILSAVNTYSGGTRVVGATLQVTNDQSAGTGTITLESGSFQADGFSDLTIANNFKINSGGSGGAIDSNGTMLTIAGNISDGAGAGKLTVLDNSFGSGVVVLTGTNTYTGGTFICSCAALQLGDATRSGSIVGAVINEGFFSIVNADTSGVTMLFNDFSGTTQFLNATSASSMVITNNGQIYFGDPFGGGTDTATAGRATILNDGGLVGFFGQTNAGAATITNQNGGGIAFVEQSSAASATIVNKDFGTTLFGTSSGSDTATAGNATIINEADGRTSFGAFATAANATIITKDGGETSFFDNSTGGNARFITTGTGIVDFGGSLGPNSDRRITAGSIEGSGTYYIGGGNTLVVGGNNASTEVSGVIGDFNPCGCGPAGSGSLEKVGSGKLILSGTNAYTGSTTVNGGVLQVDGSIAASSLTTVNAGGALTGIGVVGEMQVANGGIFAPGSGTPGSSITVQGSLAFQSGALYLVTLSSASSSFAAVTGNVVLNGTVVAPFLPGSTVLPRYTIMQFGGASSGNFTGVATFGGLVGTTTVGAGVVYLDFALDYGAKNNLNVNQSNVATALQDFFKANGGLPAVYAGLSPAGLTQASGESATGSQQTTFDAMNLFISLLTDVFGSGRSGAPGATPYADETSANAYAATGKGARDKTTRDAFASISRKAPAATFEQRWDVWAAGYGGSQTTDGNVALGSNNTSSSVYGTAVGLDYRFSPSTIAGFALAGGGTGFNVNGLGWGRSDLFQAGAFVRHTMGPAYITAALAYGWQDVTTNRIVTAAGIDQLRAQFNANALSGRVEGGYRYATQWIGLTPYAAAQATLFSLPNYSEFAVVGNSTFALNYGARDVTSSRTELGLRADKSFAAAGGLMTLRGRLAWAHDYNPDRTVGAVFQTLPGAAFVVNGAAQARDSALTTASVQMSWMNGWSASATFEGEFSNVTRSYAGKGVVRYAW
ncbi:autotransporter domain-containing protein [Bradyrhizobium xenonodulans]|uniref:Autotransporter domain-containing protein n=1 Tax=Bradyrhizobium xenonodulans TaxID=2736875 RepID=A0ABY7MJW5_9BRAD|nr:autotransporter domain-containing protein [Bradyrhizobium xenonodulans]WBL78690.1 autotransporter domain-containing protein [Bradyrhizobium xenonodulans]